MKLSLFLAPAVLISALVSVVTADEDVTPKMSGKTCLVPEDTYNYGKGKAWILGDKNPFYILSSLPRPEGTGQPGSCGLKYTDSSNIACVGSGWINADVKNKISSKCNAWIEARLGDKQVYARISDSCGHSCNDVYFPRAIMHYLGGHAAVTSGHLNGKVRWRVLSKEPFWACEAGLPGIHPNGTKDSCDGEDDFGCKRNGRKRGEDRIVGPAVFKQCPKFPSTLGWTPADKHKTPAPKGLKSSKND